MNKQAVIFLTLFSCILMLSIYYITTPISENQMVSSQSQTIEEIAALIHSDLASEIEEQSRIIASGTTLNSEKKNALVKLDSLKMEQELADKVSVALTKCNYVNAVAVSGDVIKMTVESEASDKEKASKIINCAHAIGGDTHLYEVTFLLK